MTQKTDIRASMEMGFSHPKTCLDFLTSFTESNEEKEEIEGSISGSYDKRERRAVSFCFCKIFVYKILQNFLKFHICLYLSIEFKKMFKIVCLSRGIMLSTK